MEPDERKTAAIFKALGDENRIRILKMLMSGEKCACVLLEELNVVQSTLSSHMKILCEAGLVSDRKEGKWKHYTLSRKGFENAVEILRCIGLGTGDMDSEKSCGR